MVTNILGKEQYKSYPFEHRINSCINTVESIIETFSNDNTKTCNNCRRLVADIISLHLLGAHEVRTSWTGEGI